MESPSIFAKATWLSIAGNLGYGALPIPTVRDAQITSLIREWQTLDALKREDESGSLTEDQAQILLAYSERMASLAVRERSRGWIFLGLLALGIDGWRADWRENVLVLSLHLDACERIGADPDSTFRDATKLLNPRVATVLRAFLRRSPEDKSLEAMGYKAGTDNDGFRYQRTW